MMSIIFLTGMLLYEGYRLWLWGNLAPGLPILPPPVRDQDEIDFKTDYISTAMTASATTFDTDKHLIESGFTLAPDISYQTTTRNDLSTVQFVTNTNNLFTQADGEKITATVPESSDPLHDTPEIESVSDNFDNIRNSSKLSDLLLLLRLHSNKTHKVNIYIKKKNKDTDGKPTAFHIIFNALNSKPQSLTSDLSHAMNSIKPTYGEIPKSYSTLINAETTTATDQLNQISQLASTITIPQNERITVKKLKTNTAPETTPNTANEDTLQTVQMNDPNKYTRDPRNSDRGLIRDLNYLIPYISSQNTVHEIEDRITNNKTEAISKENTYSLPTPVAHNKNIKSIQETKTTLPQLFKKVKRNCRYIKDRKMRQSRLYYTKSYTTEQTEPKAMELQIDNTTIESSTQSNIVNEWNSTTNLFKITREIEDEEDEFSDETEVHTQFEIESTTSSLKTLDTKQELNSTPIDNEEDESESGEETEETPTKPNKNKFGANFKRKLIEIPKKVDEVTTINDEEDEIDSGEVTEISTATQDDNNSLIENKNKRNILPTTKSLILKKHIDAEIGYDNIRYEKNNRKIRTSKPFYVINSTKKDVKVTNYLEEEPDSAETTSVSTTIGDDPEETPAEGMDILFILKTRLDKQTGATTSFESKDLLQILAPKSTIYRLDNDTSYLDRYKSN